jgi:hypothetical protein
MHNKLINYKNGQKFGARLHPQLDMSPIAIITSAKMLFKLWKLLFKEIEKCSSDAQKDILNTLSI